MAHSYSPRALRDISAIYEYIAKDSPSGAQHVLDRIEEVAAMLGEYPFSGRLTRKRDIRVYPLNTYPYLIFFRQVPAKREVRILRVRHAARRPVHLNDPAREFVRA
jgi:plasmid stabilization system protein ParE